MAALLLEDRPGGERTLPQATAWPLGALFAFDEIGWLETEALSARLRAAWPMRSAADLHMLADAHRAVPAFRPLAEHPRLLAAAQPALATGVRPRLVASWLLFDGADEPPLQGDVRITVSLSGEQRGRVWRGHGATIPERIRFIADYVGEAATALRNITTDDALWPCALACAG